MAKKRKLQQPGTPGSGSSSKKRQHQGGGKAAGKPHKQRHLPAADPEPDAAAEQEEEEELAVSDEDVEFVQQYGQQLGFLQQLNPQELERSIKAKQQKQTEAAAAAAAAAAAKAAAAAAAAAGNGDDSDAEAEEYERRPRAAEQERKGPSTQGLPVKTAAGEVVFAPNKQQQRLLTASRIQVEGVTVEDDLAAAQQQQQQKLAGRKRRDGAAAAAAEEEEEEGASESEEEGEPSAAAKVAQQVQKVAAEQPDLPPALLSLMSIADQARRREALKQQMALAAQHLLAEPEKHIGPGLRLLSVCASDADGAVARLALLSLLAVFKDLLPGYRIRGVSGEEAQMKVSKEVQALRDFEAALLKGYQAYLKTLLAAATAAANSSSSSSSARLATARVAVRCMGQLLVAKPGFNYSSDLLQALVPQMVSPDREIAQLAVDAVRMLLQEDIQGKTSLEGVQLVADLVRKRRCVLDPSVVGALLVLRFEAVTPTQQGGEGVGRQAQKGGKKGRKRSKKKSDLERDLEEAQAAPDARELALLQSQMLEALFEVFFRVLKHCAASTSSSSTNSTAAAADPAAAAAAADPLSSSSGSGSSAAGVLTQPWPAAKVHRKFPLLQPTLTGLGRYSHLISVEYFNDLMGVLQELLSTGALPVRERLCVLLAALDILRGQGEALTIDRRAFYNQLYNTLQLVPLSVLYEGLTAAGSSGGSGQGSQQQPGKSAAAAEDEESEQELLVEVQRALDAVRISQLGWEAAAPGSSSSSTGSSTAQQQQQPTAVLLLRCLEQQLLGVKQTDMARLAAFVKRLAGLMLSCSVGEALGAACLLWRLLKRYPKLVCLLEWEGGAPVGGQQYEPYCDDPSEAGAMASALWELPLLSQHYHPHTAAAAKLLLTLTPGSSRGQGAAAAGVGAIADVLAGALGPQQVAATYEPVRRGGFRPGPQVPRQGSGGQQGKGAAGGSSKAQMAARVAAAAGPLTGSLLAAVQQQQQQQGSAAAGARASAAATVVAVNGAQQSGSSRKRKQQQQQQGADTKGFASLLQQLVAAAIEGVDMQAVEAAVRQQYRLRWHHRRNQQLRRQAAIAARKVELFREHLIRKHQEQQQQARKKQKVSTGSGAGQHKKGKSRSKAQQH